MSLSIKRYFVTTGAGNKRILAMPFWDDYEDVASARGEYVFINYLSQHYNFPYEATWFCATDQQKAAIDLLGFPDVVSVESVIASGDTMWYLDEAHTKYITFGAQGTTLNLVEFYENNTMVYRLSVSTANFRNDSNTRYWSIPSSRLNKTNRFGAEDLRCYTWSFQNIPTNAPANIYCYYNDNVPTPLSASASEGYHEWWEGVEAANPYTPIDPSGEEGWDGTYDDEDDENPLDPLPTISFVDAGFCRIYNPSISQLHSLAQYMWTDTTFLQTVINHLKQLLENPMDAIISLGIVPVSVPNSAAEEVKVMFIPTGVYMPPATQQFVEVDCGSMKIKKNVGCALDYNPYTRIHVYLPYIGTVTLNTDEVMDKTLTLKYRVDIVTGICTAIILVDNKVMYLYSGHCSVSQPITSADFSGYLNAMITAAKSVAAVAAGAGGAPGIAAGLSGLPGPRTSSRTEIETSSYTTRNPNTGRQVTRGTSTDQFQRYDTSEGAQFGEVASRNATNTVSQVMNSKLIVEHANGFGGNSGYLAQRTPFVIIERARLCNPNEYGKYNGFPSMMYLDLGTIHGYTEVQQIQLTGINATNTELSEISQLLKTGVVL